MSAVVTRRQYNMLLLLAHRHYNTDREFEGTKIN